MLVNGRKQKPGKLPALTPLNCWFKRIDSAVHCW
jgi:hypothetical protein